MSNYKKELIKEEPELAAMLASRVVPEPSADLCQRIVFAAQKQPQQIHATLGAVLERLCTEYLTLKPAMAFASMLVFGFILGLSTSDVSIQAPASQAADFGAALYIDGGVL